MQTKNQKAFTLLELTFVIVIVGILSAIAIPKFAATRDDATITKAITTVAAVRNAIATERQKRILKGDFNPITALSANIAYIFDTFNADRDGVTNRVLEYPLPSCATLGKASGCWKLNAGNYRYVLPSGMGNVDFTIGAAGAWTNSFNCVSPNTANCKLLTQ